MKPLTNKQVAIQMIEDALINPPEGLELVKLLQYIFYITSPRVTITDFTQAANMAAKSFRVRRAIEKLSNWQEMAGELRILLSPKKGAHK